MVQAAAMISQQPVALQCASCRPGAKFQASIIRRHFFPRRPTFHAIREQEGTTERVGIAAVSTARLTMEILATRN